jgi:hypothetical protein
MQQVHDSCDDHGSGCGPRVADTPAPYRPNSHKHGLDALLGRFSRGSGLRRGRRRRAGGGVDHVDQLAQGGVLLTAWIPIASIAFVSASGCTASSTSVLVGAEYSQASRARAAYPGLVAPRGTALACARGERWGGHRRPTGLSLTLVVVAQPPTTRGQPGLVALAGPGGRAGQVNPVRLGARVPGPAPDFYAPRGEPVLREVEPEGTQSDRLAEHQRHGYMVTHPGNELRERCSRVAPNEAPRYPHQAPRRRTRHPRLALTALNRAPGSASHSEGSPRAPQRALRTESVSRTRLYGSVAPPSELEHR